MKDYRDFSWGKNKLFMGTQYMGKIFKDKKHSHMWWVEWPDGVISTDFYNGPHAKDNLVKFHIEKINTELRNANRSDDTDPWRHPTCV